MVNIVRTQADLLDNLFQTGQPDGSITSGDLLDLIVSLTPSSACGHFSSPAVVDIITQSTWTGVSSGTSTLINNTVDISMPQDGRIHYDGTTDRYFMISVSLSVTVVGNNQDLQFRLTKNGISISHTVASRSWGTGADEGSLSIITEEILSAGDYIEIEATNNTSTGDITFQNGTIVLHGHIK